MTNNEIILKFIESRWNMNIQRCKTLQKKGRHIIWGLSSQQFISKSLSHSCFYCAQVPNKTIKHPETGEIIASYLGIDRLDSNKSYTPKNTVPCCDMCNYAKNDQELENFILRLDNLDITNFFKFMWREPEASLLSNPAVKIALRSRKSSALKRHKVWELSDEEAIYLFTLPCQYCKTTDSSIARTTSKIPVEFHHNGIDRFNNAEGYIKGNVLPCCKYCNLAKRDMPDIWWSAWCLLMKQRLPSLKLELKRRKLLK